MLELVQKYENKDKDKDIEKTLKDWDSTRTNYVRQLLTQREATIVKRFMEKLKEKEKGEESKVPEEYQNKVLKATWEEIKLDNKLVYYLSVQMVGKKLKDGIIEYPNKGYWQDKLREISVLKTKIEEATLKKLPIATLVNKLLRAYNLQFVLEQP